MILVKDGPGAAMIVVSAHGDGENVFAADGSLKWTYLRDWFSG